MYTYGKWVFTQVALGELAALIVTLLVSLFLGMSVYWDLRFDLSYHRALSGYASGRLEVAIPSIEHGLKYRGDFAPARELKAKILIDDVFSDARSEESLNQAEQMLKINVQTRSGLRSASTYLGLAAICMKRFDIARASKKVPTTELQDALAHLSDAEAVDAESVDVCVARAHILFRQGNKVQAELALAEAQKGIDEATKEDDLPTIDTLVDYYVGWMVVANDKKDYTAARAAARRVLMLRPGASLPLANVAVFEARRLIESEVPREEFELRINEQLDLVNRLTALNTEDPVRNRYALDAAYGLSEAIAITYARFGDDASAGLNFGNTIALDVRRPAALYSWIESYWKLANQEPNATRREFLIFQGRQIYPRVNKLELTPEQRIASYNNMAVYSFIQEQNRDEAINYLEQGIKGAAAARVKPWCLHRNLAVIYDKAEARDPNKVLAQVKLSLELKPDQPDMVQLRDKYK